MITLHAGDNRDSLRRLIDQGVRVHAVVTDPPYGLTSVTKRFGAENAAPAKYGTDGAFARASGGFMGSKWDATGIERDPEFWKLVWEILLPGGYCVAFSSPRTGHWQACAMEMAGFVMHPFLGWVYGQGFPKASNAQRAVDAACCERPGRHYEVNLPSEGLRPDDHVCAMSAAGRAWAGWAYGTQSSKPALEPIYVGQKPFSEKNGALNLLKFGVGAINIDGCRVGWNGAPPEIGTPGWGGPKKKSTAAPGQEGETVDRLPPSPLGRHPANLLHDGSPEVVALFPAQAGAAAPVKGTEPSSVTDEIYGKFAGRVPGTFFNDSGSAARFFNAFPLTEADYADLAAADLIVELDGDVIRYQPKASKADRAGSKHPTVKPIDLKRWLCRLVTPPGGTVLDPFAGSGTTGAAAIAEGFQAILMEADPQYIADIRRRFGLTDDLEALLGIDEPSADSEADAYDMIG